MKNFFIFVTVASLAPALLLACASGGGDGLGGGGSGGTGPSKTSSPSSTVGGQTNTVASVTSSSTGGGCGTCNINSDCTNTCAAAPAGESNCCDTQNHMCYLNQQPSCPVQATSSSASTGTSMY